MTPSRFSTPAAAAVAVYVARRHNIRQLSWLLLISVLLTACQRHSQDTPLAFVPANTPYVLTNIKPLHGGTRRALLARLNAELPTHVARLRALATNAQSSQPAQAKLLKALADELDAKTAEQFARDIGLDLHGQAAFYGVGLAPVLRAQLTNRKAFDGFINYLAQAYGTRLQDAQLDRQHYRLAALPDYGSELVFAIVKRQAVLAIVPASPDPDLLRRVLGLTPPVHSLLANDTLSQLAKDHNYQPWLIGQIDTHRLLELITSNHEPLLHALLLAHASPEAARTGEPVERLIAIPHSCRRDAERIAGRIGSLSLGYTRLDPRHQNLRWHISLADDLVQMLHNWSWDLPGLREPLQTPLDLRVALPVAELRQLLDEQAKAIADQPFICPVLSDLNTLASRAALLSRQLATPPIGDLLGLRLAINRLPISTGSDSLSLLDGRLILASRHTDILLATAQLFLPAMHDFQPAPADQSAPLPPALDLLLGQPAWLALDNHALALGVGPQATHYLAATLTAGHPRNDSQGELLQLHFDGSMYRQWQRYTAAETSHELFPSNTAKALNYTGFSAPAVVLDPALDRLQSYHVTWSVDADGLNIDNCITLKP